MVTEKVEARRIDGTPIKRMFLSIISDYNLQTGLCELVDNAVDLWIGGKTSKPPYINLDLDWNRQLIRVSDDAGGVKSDDLHLLIQPGGSGHHSDSEVIGTFGVGSKRAGIALGEQVVIRTRHRRQQTYELSVTQQWLETDTWELPAYELPDIQPGTTEVEISKLRRPFSSYEVGDLRLHLGATYGRFIERGCIINLVGRKVEPISYDSWAYPPGHSPVRANLTIDLGPGGILRGTITGGLILDRDAEEENYGIYFYCNDRLIAHDLKSREVGYNVRSEAGVPHPDASLCRVIVELYGPAESMPWNSSKSGINYDHPAFQQLRPTLLQLVTHFSSLSRRFKDDWEGKVYSFADGVVGEVEPVDPENPKRLHLPKLPQARKRQVEHLKSRNRRQLLEKPWTLGMLEALGAVEMISRQKLETKGRIALILLDSNFEIALKEFIVHNTNLFPLSQFNEAALRQLFKHRDDVIDAVRARITIEQRHVDLAKHYYAKRNKLIHERATVDIPDSDIRIYQNTIQNILTKLFGLQFPR